MPVRSFVRSSRRLAFLIGGVFTAVAVPIAALLTLAVVTLVVVVLIGVVSSRRATRTAPAAALTVE